MQWGVNEYKASFFDRATIEKQIDEATKKVLGEFGAFSRKRAKSIVKYKKGRSAPGQPPHAHRSQGFTKQKKDKKTGQMVSQPASPFRELIFFGLDVQTQSVVIGPAIGGSRSGAVKTLEHGGTVVIDGKSRYVEARPTMVPAAEEAKSKLGSWLRGSIN